MRKLSLTITGLAVIGGLLSFPAEASATTTTQSQQATFSKGTSGVSFYKPKKRKAKRKPHHKCDAYNG